MKQLVHMKQISIALGALIALSLLGFSQTSYAADSIDGQQPSVFEEMALVNGQLPKPFKAIIETIRANQGRPFRVQIEATDIDGRSLQAPASTTKFPRNITLVSTEFSAAIPGTNEYLFAFGYTPTDGKIEIVSWNRHTRKFDFIEVTGYSPASTEAVRINKKVEAICLSCHQAKAPILSRFPWLELTSQNQNLRRNTDRSRQQLTAEEIELVKFLQTEPILQLNSQTGQLTNGGSDTVSSLSGFSFDLLVRRSNRTLQASKMCSTLCAPGAAGLTCRRHTFLISIFGDDLFESPEVSMAWKAGYVSMVSKRWPKDDFAYASSVLPDRDPTDPSAKEGVVTIPVVKNPAQAVFDDIQRTFCNGAQDRRDSLARSFGVDPATSTQMSCQKVRDVESVIFRIAGKEEVFPLIKSKIVVDRLKRAGSLVHSEVGTTSLFGQTGGVRSEHSDALRLPYTRTLEVNGASVPNPADPTVQRPLISHLEPSDAPQQLIANGSFGCFGITSLEIAQLFQSKAAKTLMVRKLMRSNEFNQLLNESWPPSREQTEALFISLGKEGYTSKVSGESAKQLMQNYSGTKLSAPTVTSGTAAKPSYDLKSVVQQRCAVCHGSADSPRPLPLGGTSSEVATALSGFRSKTSGHSLKDYLQGNGVPQMPLGNSTGLTPDEREFLIQTLK